MMINEISIKMNYKNFEMNGKIPINKMILQKYFDYFGTAWFKLILSVLYFILQIYLSFYKWKIVCGSNIQYESNNNNDSLTLKKKVKIIQISQWYYLLAMENIQNYKSRSVHFCARSRHFRDINILHFLSSKSRSK